MSDLTNRQKILNMVQRWPEDIAFDRAVYHLTVLAKIEEGLSSLDRGEWVDADEVFAELLGENEESQGAVLRPRKKRLAADPRPRATAGVAKNSGKARVPNKKRGE